ncbi:MAG: hypothetical protein JKY48_03250 [Flavobacteriales bacterium]|nr:hypothetical protein [Flavobacteriales bacterium]
MKLKHVFLFFSILVILFSCRRDEDFIEDSSAKVNFSTDSISFDTVFTTIGSATHNFRIYNPHSDRIKISSIRLNGGSSSNFRINVDGQAGTSFNDIEIASKDSAFVFVEVTVNPSDSSNPFVIEDFIEFNTNGNSQRVILTAWGQNAIYYTPTTFNRNLPDFTCLTGPCGDDIPPVDVTWTDSLPIVVYGFIAVDTADRLTIEAGTRVYFHNSGGMWVYKGGTLKVNGTKESPVLFTGDRLEAQYANIPGQWDRIWINEGGVNEINYAIIENAFVGIQAEALFLDAIEPPLGNLTIRNTIINNCSGIGLLSAYFNFVGENLVITNCGESNTILQAKGNWRFDHSTIANYSTFSSRETPAFFVKNSYNAAGKLKIDTPLVSIRNSIIHGNEDSEFEIEIVNNGGVGIRVLNSILKTEVNTSNAAIFSNVIKNPSGQIFNDAGANDFELFDMSVAKDQGDATVGNAIRFDLNGEDRTLDSAPDMGAYEFK